MVTGPEDGFTDLNLILSLEKKKQTSTKDKPIPTIHDDKGRGNNDILDDVNWQEEWDTGHEYDLEYREKLSPGEKYKAFIEGPTAMLDKGCVYSAEDVRCILGQQVSDVLFYDMKKAIELDSTAMQLWITNHPEFNKEREKQLLELRK